MPECSRIVSVRLSDSELSALNLLMEKQGYKGLGDLLGAIATGRYKVGIDAISSAVERILRSYYTEQSNSTKTYITRPDHEGSAITTLGSSSSLV